MSDMSATNNTVQKPVNLTLQKSLNKKIAFLPNEAGTDYIDLIIALFNLIHGNFPEPSDQEKNLLPRLMIRECNAPPYSQGQSAEIAMDYGLGQYHPLGNMCLVRCCR
jgi:hypothetical protein